MRLLKTLLILTTFAIIAFAWYHQRPDRTWISEHSEINEAEVYGEMLMKETIERSNLHE